MHAHRRASLPALGRALGALVLLILFAGPAARLLAQGRRRAAKPAREKFDLRAWGQLYSKVRGAKGVYELNYYRKNARGRLEKVRALLSVPEKVELLRDAVVPITKLESGEKVKVFGRVVEHDVPSRGSGFGGVEGGRDLQIQNAKVALVGQERYLEVNKDFRDRRDPALKWLDTVVETSGGGLSVTFEGAPHRVVMAKGAPVFKRIPLDRKYVRRGLYIHVHARKLEERPEGVSEKSAKGKDVFEAARIIVLDRRFLRTVYPALLEDK